ncbi:MAG: rhodanese-like domain-containing protein [Paludibacteraceae bacterium]|nr:rhodanese-like domain-containing protein [Paludibacteraceae bacterium]
METKRIYKLFGCCLLGAAALLSSASCSSNESDSDTLKGYNKIRQDSSFYNAVTRITNIQLVDIRSAEEYKAGHIPYATNVEANYANSDDVNSPFCKEILRRFSMDKDIFLYGGKAQKAENWYAPGLVSTIGWGPKRTYHYLNDYESWVEKGYFICTDTSRVAGCPCQNQ